MQTSMMKWKRLQIIASCLQRIWIRVDETSQQVMPGRQTFALSNNIKYKKHLDLKCCSEERMRLSGETNSTITPTIRVCVFWDQKRNQPFNKHGWWPFVWSLCCFYGNGMSDAATEGHCVALSKSSRAFVWPAEQPRRPVSPVSATFELQERLNTPV